MALAEHRLAALPFTATKNPSSGRPARTQPAEYTRVMSEPLKLQDLMEVNGVVAALRWQQSRFINAIAYPARLVEYLGFDGEERARQLMLSAEAMGLSIKGVLEIDYYRDRTGNPHSLMPADGYMIHGQKFNLVCTLNRVAVLVDNKVDYDLKGLFLKAALVRND
jgi:roadblock/LC7 domain-containing protein